MRVAIFVDAANMFKAQQRMKWHIDYKKILQYFAKGKDLTEHFFFTGTPYFKEPEKIGAYRRYRKFLIHAGYTVVEKETKEVRDRDTGKRKRISDLDVHIVMYMMNYANRYDELVLLSGDTDFVPVLEHLRNTGKEITCVAEEPGALDLRNVSDRFVGLNSIRKKIEK
ncbi:hypothetical protein ES703_125299 [subsurface metagenome]